MSEVQATKLVNVSDDLVRDLIKERRRDRFWRNLRFFLGFLLFVLFISLMMGGHSGRMAGGDESKDYVSLVRLDGMIAPHRSFSAEEALPALELAFRDKKAKGVIIDINSGGGTPVQAAIIHDEILRLKEKYHKKVVVVGEDMLASGAYFVAVSADAIYVNPNTVTGSIGVIMAGFGLEDGIKKLGVDRRVITAGDHKDRLDPFLPLNPEDVAKMHTVIGEVHENFSDAVKHGRMGKLKGDPKELFSGDFWTGVTAQKLGLVDHLGNVSDAMQAEFQVSRFEDYTDGNNPFKKLANQLGVSLQLPLSALSFQLWEKI